MYPSRQSYEIQTDYAMREQVVCCCEAGFGKGKIDYEKLKYATISGYFVRLGIDQSVLDRLGPATSTWRLSGSVMVSASATAPKATYLVPSLFGPPASGSVPAQGYVVHWGEITGGVKVKIGKGYICRLELQG